jgi:hypothetical protein
MFEKRSSACSPDAVPVFVLQGIEICFDVIHHEARLGIGGVLGFTVVLCPLLWDTPMWQPTIQSLARSWGLSTAQQYQLNSTAQELFSFFKRVHCNHHL